MKDYIYQQYLFHYNPFTEKWTAFHREDYVAFFNGCETKHRVIKSKHINTVFFILEKTNGDDDAIDNLSE